MEPEIYPLEADGIEKTLATYVCCATFMSGLSPVQSLHYWEEME